MVGTEEKNPPSMPSNYRLLFYAFTFLNKICVETLSQLHYQLLIKTNRNLMVIVYNSREARQNAIFSFIIGPKE